VVRLVCLLERKPGLSPEEFSAYWRDEHGPLVAGYQARLNLLRYSQVHRDPSAEAADLKARGLRGGMLPPYDGVTEMWWASEETLRTAMATSAGAQALAELIADEDRFVNLAASPLWFAHEYPQVSTQRGRPVASPKSGTVRVTLPLRPLPSLNDAQARSYWLTVHGPVVRSHAVARGAIGYQQVHRYDSELADDRAGPSATSRSTATTANWPMSSFSAEVLWPNRSSGTRKRGLTGSRRAPAPRPMRRRLPRSATNATSSTSIARPSGPAKNSYSSIATGAESQADGEVRVQPAARAGSAFTNTRS
jgi:uncharacterized protein (TIGR02118 family)